MNIAWNGLYTSLSVHIVATVALPLLITAVIVIELKLSYVKTPIHNSVGDTIGKVKFPLYDVTDEVIGLV